MGKRKYTKEEERVIAEEWINTSTPVRDLCEKYGYKTPKSITDKVKKYFPEVDVVKHARERVKTYSLNFEHMDTSFKAYLLGLMYTDGYVSSDTRYGIDLIDEDCIQYLSEQTGQKYNKYDHKDNLFQLTPESKVYTRQPRYRILWQSRDNVNQWATWGVTRRKTENIEGCDLSRIPRELWPDLARGVIDGDGCIYQHSSGRSISFYIMTKNFGFAEWCKDLLEAIGMSDVRINQTKEGMYKVESARFDNIKVLHDTVYATDYGMKRKMTLHL